MKIRFRPVLDCIIPSLMLTEIQCPLKQCGVITAKLQCQWHKDYLLAWCFCCAVLTLLNVKLKVMCPHFRNLSWKQWGFAAEIERSKEPSG